MFCLNIKIGMAWLQLIYSALNLPVLRLIVIAFDDIVASNCILNSIADKLKAAMNHRVEKAESCFF